MKLDAIGFRTLCDDRARNLSSTSPLWRACFLITHRCNFQCPYCNMLRGAPDMDFEQFRTILTDMVMNHRLRNVRFTGGEPTLHPRLVDMVKLVRDMGVQGIAISTNGSADMSFYEALVRAGVNDFAVSCDTNDMVVGKALAGVKRDDTWLKVITNIRAMSKLAYVNLGITINALNCNDVPEILAFTDDLGVADMKLSTATSWNRIIQRLGEVPQDLLARHPILRYRVNGFLAGRNVRGLREGVDCHRCPLVQDDIILVDGHHYPCLVYAREKGQPIGTLKDVAEMREERRAWQASRDTHTDPICKPMCMDIFMDCNNRITELQGPIKT